MHDQFSSHPAARVVVVELAGAIPLELPQAVTAVRVRPLSGEPLPEVGSFDGLIVTGSDLSAHTIAERSVLDAVVELTGAAAARGVVLLGIGAGAQAIALACGGQVAFRAPIGPECGVVGVRLRPDAATDPILGSMMAAYGRDIAVPARHEDAITELPEGAVWLASSTQYPFQAFRLGSAIGLQFHPGATLDHVLAWAGAADSRDANDGGAHLGSAAVSEAWETSREQLEALGTEVFAAFCAEVADRARISLS